MEKLRKLITILFTGVLIVSCGDVEPIPAATATVAGTITVSPIPVSASSSPTIQPATLTPQSTSPIPVSSAPDGLRMAYIIDGNLYFQDGSNLPIQLTYSGEDRRPIFTDDGEMIFFFRGGKDRVHSIHSINIDGKGEQVLFTIDLLLTFGAEYESSTTFCDLSLVPRSHRLLFRTCSHPRENALLYHDDLFLLDADPAQVEILFRREQGGIYYISPNGNMLAVDRDKHIDIVSIEGEMMYSNLIAYSASEPVPLASRVYWISNSGELIIAIPINTYYETGLIPQYALWRYSLDIAEGLQISIHPSPSGQDPAKISPDGNHIIYMDFEEGSFYIGDLHSGNTKVYVPKPGVYRFYDWSLDNIHFIYEIAEGRDLYIGSLNNKYELIGRGQFIGWINSTQYLYSVDKALLIGDVNGMSMPIMVGSADLIVSDYLTDFSFNYQ